MKTVYRGRVTKGDNFHAAVILTCYSDTLHSLIHHSIVGKHQVCQRSEEVVDLRRV
jgi:hypothetical protein